MRNASAPAATYQHLQAAIDAASPGDVLAIRGRCRGGFLVDKSLTLRGVGRERPTLAGAHRQRVLTITGSASANLEVSLDRLRVVRGYAEGNGGGLWSRFADVRLVRTLVRRNEARQGGGVYVRGGLELIDSTLQQNQAAAGGGAYAWHGMALRGRSRVTGNEAGWAGGISSSGPVDLSGRSTIADNLAGGAGGISLNGRARLELSGSASVRGNIATGNWAGVFSSSARARAVVIRQHASVVGNVTAGEGGGLVTFGGVTLRGHARVTHNQAGTTGGGVFAYGPVMLRGSALVAHNLAVRGAGLVTMDSRLVLKGQALVTTNAAAEHGGGALVRYQNRPRVRVRGAAAIQGNSPDDLVTRQGGFLEPPQARVGVGAG